MLAASGGRAQAGLPAHRQRPAEDRARAPPAARALRRGRGRAALGEGRDRRRRGRRLQRDGPVRRPAAGSCSSTRSSAGRRADAKAVADYLAAPAPDTVLALVGEELRKDSPLAKALCEGGRASSSTRSRSASCRSGSPSSSPATGSRRPPRPCRALVELVGDNLQELASEIDKLSLCAGQDEIGRGRGRAARRRAGRRSAVRPHRRLGAPRRRRGARRLRVDPRALDPLGRGARCSSGGSRRTSAASSRCQNLDAEGVRPRDAAGQLKMHPFAAEKAFAQSRNFSVDELREAIVAPRRPRSRAEGRQPPAAGARAPAHARRDHDGTS